MLLAFLLIEFAHTLFCVVFSFLSASAEPYAIFTPLFEPKCIQFANKEEGLKRRQHYSKALSEDAMRKNFPQLQQVNPYRQHYNQALSGGAMKKAFNIYSR